MQWMRAHGHIAANPVMAVDYTPPKQSTQATHQPAMPWPLVPQFVATHLAQHTPGRTKCPDPGALFHPTATCPRTRRPAACRHHQKENCFRCEVNAGMGAALDGKVDDVTNPMSTEGLADPAGGDNAHANAGAALRRYRRQAVHQSKALTRALADCGSVSGTSAPAKAAPQWRAARSPDAHLTSEYSRVPENNTSSIDAERSSVVICRGPDARTLVTRPRLAQPVPMGTSTSRNAPNATTPLPAS